MIGTDIIEIARVAEAVKKEGFVKKVFTAYEQEYFQKNGCNPQTYAGIFAAKEAVAKALKTGFNNVKQTDIEILHGVLGAPYAKLHGQAAEIFKMSGKQNIEISISHCKEYATAVCVVTPM